MAPTATHVLVRTAKVGNRIIYWRGLNTHSVAITKALGIESTVIALSQGEWDAIVTLGEAEVITSDGTVWYIITG